MNIKGVGGSQDDKFHGITKRHVKQGSEGVTHLTGNGLGGEAKHTGQRNHGNTVHGENDTAGNALDLGKDDTQGHKDEQNIQPAVGDDQPKGPTSFLDKGAPLLLLASDAAVVIAGVRSGAVVSVVHILGFLLHFYDSPLPLSLRRCDKRIISRGVFRRADGWLLRLLLVESRASRPSGDIGIEDADIMIMVVDGVVAVESFSRWFVQKRQWLKLRCRRTVRESIRCGMVCTRAFGVYVGGA